VLPLIARQPIHTVPVVRKTGSNRWRWRISSSLAARSDRVGWVVRALLRLGGTIPWFQIDTKVAVFYLRNHPKHL